MSYSTTPLFVGGATTSLLKTTPLPFSGATPVFLPISTGAMFTGGSAAQFAPLPDAPRRYGLRYPMRRADAIPVVRGALLGNNEGALLI